MSKELLPNDKQGVKRPEPEDKGLARQRPPQPGGEAASLLHLQQQVGNQAVQRLIALRPGSGQVQRSGGDGAFELDEDTTGRINQARGGGQTLDSAVQTEMGEAMGHDFSGVRVHTSTEADELNQQLNARAFTTGQDIFFKQGEYNPGSGSGRELLAHELTHVVQQGSGKVGGGGSGMVVNPPDDAFEHEADSIASQVTGSDSNLANQTGGGEAVQRQSPEEEELQAKAIQRQDMPEEEELQAKTIQRQDMPEEEELQAKTIQRQDMPEEEEVMA